MDSNMIADSSQPHADRSSLLRLQNSFTAVINISYPIPPSHVKCHKIPNLSNSYSFTFIKFIEAHNSIKSMSMQIFGVAARGLRSLSLLAKEATCPRSISTMDLSGAVSLSSDHLLKYQIILVEDITPHSCVGGCRSSDSAYRSQNSGGDRKDTGAKKHKAHHGGNTGDFSETNGDDQNQDPGGARRALCTDDLEAIVKMLACPFQKFDPTRYDKCAGYKLSTWDRVLQHIKRKHLLRGEYCPDCRKQFEGRNAEDRKNEHIRGDCQPATAIETGRLLQGEYDDLTGVGPGDQVMKWFKGWAILFRGHLEPLSPFAETLLKVKCDLTRGRLPDIVQSFKRDRGQHLTYEDLVDMGSQIIDEVERGSLPTPPRQVLQLTSAQLSTGFDTTAVPLESEVPADYHTPVPLFNSGLEIVPNMSLSLPESQAPPVMHWSIPDITGGEPLQASIQPLATILHSSDHIAFSQPPMLQWDPSSHEQHHDSIFQQPLDASIFRQSVDPWTQDPNDALAIYFDFPDFTDFTDYPALEDGTEDVADFAEGGVPI